MYNNSYSLHLGDVRFVYLHLRWLICIDFLDYTVNFMADFYDFLFLFFVFCFLFFLSFFCPVLR